MLALRKNRIDTGRLILRPPVMDDAGRIAELANHAAIAHRLATMPYPYNVSDAVEFIDRIATLKGGAAFAITLKDMDGAVIGMTGYGPNEAGETDFGYWLGLDSWGKGYASEAGHGVVTHAFCIACVDDLETDYQLDNIASARVLEKLGFHEVGPRRRFSLGAGKDVDTMMVRLTCDDWLASMACAQAG